MAVARRRAAGNALTQHQAERFGERRLVLTGEMGVAGAPAVLVEQDVEVVGDALHAARAERLDSRELKGIEHAPGVLARGRVRRVDAGIVIAHPERHHIAGAAQGGNLARLRGVGRHRHARLVTDQSRRLAAEGHGEFRLFGDGPHRGGDRAGEDLDRLVGLDHPARIIPSWRWRWIREARGRSCAGSTRPRWRVRSRRTC